MRLLRLVTGLVIASFVVGHFLNHSLGVASIGAGCAAQVTEGESGEGTDEGALGGEVLEGDEAEGDEAEGDETEPHGKLAHQLRILCSGRASQAAGSTGLPCRRSST